MSAATHVVMFPAAILERGFWLYVWRVEAPNGEYLYVGRTGDNSSPYATPPYQRMGQHLGHQKTQNALRKHLQKRGIEPERCLAFHLIAHGPLYPETRSTDEHLTPRDIVAALEKALADALQTAGYEVLNAVHCLKPVDAELFGNIRAAFAAQFPKLLAAAQER